MFWKYYLWLQYKTIFNSQSYDTDTWDFFNLNEILKMLLEVN